jgi:hypothetical protein
MRLRPPPPPFAAAGQRSTRGGPRRWWKGAVRGAWMKLVCLPWTRTHTKQDASVTHTSRGARAAWHAKPRGPGSVPGCPGRVRRLVWDHTVERNRWLGAAATGAPQAAPVASSTGRGDRAQRAHGGAWGRTTCASCDGARSRSERPTDGLRAGGAQRSLSRSSGSPRTVVRGVRGAAGRSAALRPFLWRYPFVAHSPVHGSGRHLH